MEHRISCRKSYRYDCLSPSERYEANEGKGILFTVVEYNTAGRTIRELVYDESGYVEEKKEFTYDENGNLLEEKTFVAENEMIEFRSFEIDENGRVVKELFHYQDDTVDTVYCQYGNDGNLTEKKTVTSEGDVERVEEYVYNKDRREEKVYEYEELISHNIFTYNENGKIIEEVKNDFAERDKITIKNSYDENGELAKILIYDAQDRLISRSLYEYNENNQLVQLTEENQHGKRIHTFRYDERGNDICQEEHDEKGELNSRINREHNENNMHTLSEVWIDRHGEGINQHYRITHEYFLF